MLSKKAGVKVQPENDWRFWQWVGVGALSVLAWVSGRSWKARGLLEALRQADTAILVRVAALETTQVQCRAGLRDEIRSAVQQAFDQQSLRHVEQMGEIKKDLAVLVALGAETKDDIKDIFDRLNRRGAETPYVGERRHKG